MDKFAKLAFHGANTLKSELKAVPPKEVDSRCFKPSLKRAAQIHSKSYEELCMEYDSELEKLRQKFSPFLQRHTPSQSFPRVRKDISEFSFRYQTDDDKSDISLVFDGKGEWEAVTVPDYRGPVGRWTGCYRTEFDSISYNSTERIYLHFSGVDYIAKVYLNNVCLGIHEGFFEPFEYDITDYVKEKNILVVEVKNDSPTVGIEVGDDEIDGDKIYACTGLGWDDPEIGWHHCPPGAGIYNKVYIEKRPELYVSDVFVRPLIDNNTVEVWVEIFNTHFDYRDFQLKLQVFSENFDLGEVCDVECRPKAAGPGINLYKFELGFENYRLWTTQEPWLYTLRASIKSGEITDEFDRTFGMRKFHMDCHSAPKGRLYLNNDPIILRGANDMGHMQQCVVKNDMKQLIDDILIARLANMNFYRFTQRPVQEEIYDMCDRLGMLNQTDLPVFGYMRYNLFCESIRQSAAMERLIRSHPSAVMISYVNEAISSIEKGKEHRYLSRQELEDMFECATKAVHLINPDRIVKNVEGDYDPPTKGGLSDFHCYNMWYTDHALPIGKLHKGWLPEIKEGWLTGCGEYGTEGLDSLDVMLSEYPKDWLPDNLNDSWLPSKIVQSQTFSMHGDWYREQNNVEDWIKASQNHQALATKLMTDAFRRRSDYIVQTAIHLLIDAWPSGWMKTLVDCKRRPKPAYFEFRNSLKPLRVHLRTDRWHFWEGENVSIEVWTLNDTNNRYDDCSVVVSLNGIGSYEGNTSIKPVSSDGIGLVKFQLPNGDGAFNVTANLYDSDGNLLVAETLNIYSYKGKPHMPEFVSISDYKDGDRFVFIDKEGEYTVNGYKVEVKNCGSKYFLGIDDKNEGLFMPYNKETGMISRYTEHYMVSDNIEQILYTYEKPRFNKFVFNPKKKLTVAGKLGDIYLFAFDPNCFAGVNPSFDVMLGKL